MWNVSIIFVQVRQIWNNKLKLKNLFKKTRERYSQKKSIMYKTKKDENDDVCGGKWSYKVIRNNRLNHFEING